ncbi:Oligosaccharide translocation protein rft1 [Steccherinum ochraceum]|uniref:Man(5)GlcNAc(2)-PP-dolichol translocation protein RFT1 n=1 Tax=Steccherinum ochraceum TaxID=92696 RepID=A0A4R0RXJ1_9APHY|nr:Oligosaccharide translocation protein rft1 [Steccherinum ochraceum]
MASPPSQPPPSLLSKSLASASSLVLLQLFSRLFTFALNQALVRLVSPQAFGTAAIQFELLLSTILFLSREGVRNALLRANTSSTTESKPQDTSGASGKKKKVTNSNTPTQDANAHNTLIANISLLPVLLGIPTTIITTLLYIRSSSAQTSSQPHFHLSVGLYALAAFLELLSEPSYIRAQNELRFDVRVKAEGKAVVAKTGTTFLALVGTRGGEEWALVAFALGQVVYGAVLLEEFVRVYYGKGLRWWIRKVKIGVHGNDKTQYFDTTLLHLSAAMTGQSVIKHFLTEGDKFLVSRLSPLADQGGYAIASNYGSLVARILFQPIEETSRVFFSKTLASGASIPQESLQTASSILSTILLLFTHLFLLLLTCAPPYLPLAVSILLPWRYHSTSAPSILQTYVYYIPMMAFNGVLEAFFASTATPSDLRVQSHWMLLFSLGFVGGAVVFSQYLGLGDAGLVWANIVNLFARAVYAWVFVRKYFKSKGAGDMVRWTKAVPPLSVIGCFAVAGAVTRWSWYAQAGVPLTIRAQVGHLGVGVACVLGCLGACFILERRTFQQVFAVLRRR